MTPIPPPYALVGAAGAVSVGVSGASVSPAYGQSPTAGNLLVLWILGEGSATVPTTPAGFSTVQSRAGTSIAASICTKVAAGSDAQPTISAVTSSTLIAMLAEFSGNTHQTPLGDNSPTNAGTTSPLVTAGVPADRAPGEVFVYATGAFYSASATSTLTSTLNNGASVTQQDFNNNSTSTETHYGLGFAFTTVKSAGDQDSFAFTTTNITGAVVACSSFRATPLVIPPLAVINQSPGRGSYY